LYQDGSTYGSLNLGITPDLIAQNLSGSIPGSSFSLSNNSFNPSGLNGSFNSSGFNVQQLLMPQLPMSNPEMNQFSFHPPSQESSHRGNGMMGPGEYSMLSQLQTMPNVRVNPLAIGSPMLDNGNAQQPIIHQGYGQAVSDYAAALHMKYGNAIPDLSAPKTSSQLYFSNQAKTSNEVWMGVQLKSLKDFERMEIEF
jgi:hypothetical protein